MYYEVALLAYFLDHFLGEFPIRHPVVYLGSFITGVEKVFYKDSIYRGGWLFIIVVGTVLVISMVLAWLLALLPPWLEIIMTGILSSTLIAHHMLRQSVQEVAAAETLEEKRQRISMLVSRDTEHLNEEEIHKAAIETYAENLSDGVIAPLFYLVLFGLPGIMIYKAINTLDSMVGYKNTRYLHYGRISARMDDLANWIPARLSAVLILVVGGFRYFRVTWTQARGHDSPNAGYPITAMANVLHVRLGGPTHYFGELKDKPFFGKHEERVITEAVIQSAFKVGVLSCYLTFLLIIFLTICFT